MFPLSLKPIHSGSFRALHVRFKTRKAEAESRDASLPDQAIGNSLVGGYGDELAIPIVGWAYRFKTLKFKLKSIKVMINHLNQSLIICKVSQQLYVTHKSSHLCNICLMI